MMMMNMIQIDPRQDDNISARIEKINRKKQNTLKAQQQPKKKKKNKKKKRTPHETAERTRNEVIHMWIK